MTGEKRSSPEIKLNEVSGNYRVICAEKGPGRRLCAGCIEALDGR